MIAFCWASSFGVGAGVGSAGSAWTVGAVCKDSNSLKSARSILLLLIHSRPFFALLAGIVPLVFCELFLLPSADNVLRHLCGQFQTTALELFFEGGISCCIADSCKIVSTSCTFARSSSRNGFCYDYFFVLIRYLYSYHKGTGFLVEIRCLCAASRRRAVKILQKTFFSGAFSEKVWYSTCG